MGHEERLDDALSKVTVIFSLPSVKTSHIRTPNDHLIRESSMTNHTVSLDRHYRYRHLHITLDSIQLV